MTSGAEVTIVPSCAFISPCRPRCGESSPCVRITRNTRVRETRIRSRDPAARAWTLRWPSPWNGERARVAANGRQQLRIRQCGPSARGAPGHHPALGAANKPAARRAPSATSPTFDTPA